MLRLQGRGFAVVAGEVRTLAQRSAEAATQIKLPMGGGVQKVELGARRVGNAGSTMQANRLALIEPVRDGVMAARKGRACGPGQASAHDTAHQPAGAVWASVLD